MKKLLVMIALFGLPLFALTGCGGSSENKVIEGGGEVEGSMADDQMAEYEKAMNSGAGSSGPGN